MRCLVGQPRIDQDTAFLGADDRCEKFAWVAAVEDRGKLVPEGIDKFVGKAWADALEVLAADNLGNACGAGRRAADYICRIELFAVGRMVHERAERANLVFQRQRGKYAGAGDLPDDVTTAIVIFDLEDAHGSAIGVIDDARDDTFEAV